MSNVKKIETDDINKFLKEEKVDLIFTVWHKEGKTGFSYLSEVEENAELKIRLLEEINNFINSI